MGKKWLVCLAVLTLAVGFALSAFAQESAVKGAISGVVLDTTGAAVPGAKVTLSGPMGERQTMSDASGTFTFPVLIPGFYNIRTEKENFKAATVTEIQVFVDRTSAIKVTLEPGAITQTINVTAAAETVDTTSTAVTSNFNTTFYQMIPIQRGVASLMYLAPGTKSGLGTGVANPSISGGTGLENQYVADGVSITDTAFGGLGVYNRLYGSLGSGLDLSFVQELDVKTADYEPQYGGATGGFVQIVTKSGGREFHGGISAFYAPKQFQEKPRNPNDFNLLNKFSNLVGNTTEDVAGELGGYVPGMRNHLFFYGSVDPSEVLNVVNSAAPNAPAPFGIAALGKINDRILTYNYDAKVTWRLNDNHTVEGSVFGDPSHTNTSQFRSLIVGAPLSTCAPANCLPDTRRGSKLDYGDRDWAVRYNGTLSPTWLVNADFTWMHNTFTETPSSNTYEIVNQTETGINGVAVPGQLGSFSQSGLGFLENTDDETFKSDIATSKTFGFWGSHTFSVGASLARTFYDGLRTASGPIVGMPGDNANGEVASGTGTCQGAPINCLTFSTAPFCAICVGSPTYWEFELVNAPSSCTLCPLTNVPGLGLTPVDLFEIRAEFGLTGTGKSFGTNGTFVSGYANDSWTINKYLTINAGLRWQNQRLQGVNTNYTFTDNWEPRIGVVIDPRGDRKNKIFAGFNRYSYAIPLDLAERSLTNELDLFNFNFAPAFTVNSSGQRIATLDQFGSVIPVVDSAHVINTDNGGISQFTFGSTESQEPIFAGTRMSMEDEWVVGAEHQFPHGVVLSAKFLRRDLKRIVEDTGGIPPEAALAGITQQFAITNISSSTDIFENPIEFTDPIGTPPTAAFSACAATPGAFINSAVISVATGASLGAACFLPTGATGKVPGSIVVGGDGVPDGFPDPIRQYWAMEFEVNKAFSSGWQLRANWTISRLFGNFEGAFRNDNGQSDPSISSLFDFTPGDFGLLGGQFIPGLLNTDRTHVLNIYATYVFQNGWKKGLTIGTGVRFQTGVPLTDLLPHPVYDNEGEVPNLADGGRGGLGRSSPTGTVDLHVDYPWRMTERQRLHFGVDLFNLADSRRSFIINQNNGLLFTGTQVIPNVDFKKPGNVGAGALGAGSGFVAPFNARVSVRWQF